MWYISISYKSLFWIHILYTKKKDYLLTFWFLSTCSLFEIPCRSYTIAFIVPIKEALLSLAKNCSVDMNIDSYSYEDICNDPGLVSEVLKILSAHGKNNGLEKFEIPTKIQLCPEVL